MTCDETQHHTRNGCQAVTGLLMAIRSNQEKLREIVGGDKAAAILDQIGWQLDLAAGEVKRVETSMRHCGK